MATFGCSWQEETRLELVFLHDKPESPRTKQKLPIPQGSESRRMFSSSLLQSIFITVCYKVAYNREGELSERKETQALKSNTDNLDLFVFVFSTFSLGFLFVLA